MDKLIEFMREYTAFFEEAEKKQEAKLTALASGELAQIEESIVMQQATDKQMQNMEEKRIRTFNALGFGGMTFKEVIEAAKPDRREELTALYEKLDASIGSIRFLNQKCMKIAESALVKMGTMPSRETRSGEGYQTVRRAEGSILETKV